MESLPHCCSYASLCLREMFRERELDLFIWRCKERCCKGFDQGTERHDCSPRKQKYILFPLPVVLFIHLVRLGRRNVCLSSDIMEIDGTMLAVLKKKKSYSLFWGEVVPLKEMLRESELFGGFLIWRRNDVATHGREASWLRFTWGILCRLLSLVSWIDAWFLMRRIRLVGIVW